MRTMTYAAILASLCLLSCVDSSKTELRLTTWQQTRDTALQMVESAEYDFIIDHLISDELANMMINKHGESKWKMKLKNEKLTHLPFFFGWLKKCKVKIIGEKVFLTGKHGCYAIFQRVGEKYLLLDIGQHITSM